MENKKKIVLTIWLSTLVFFILFLFLPAKADRYFISQRIYLSEEQNVQAKAFEKKGPFDFFRNEGDDKKILAHLKERMDSDGRDLAVYLGAIFLLLNLTAGLLYAFNMKVIRIIMLIMAFLLAAVFLLMQSLIKINP